jgi:hypothetical protein
VIVRYFVWRWRGSSWRLDSCDQSDPEGYRTEQAAQARVQELLGYQRRSGRKTFPPPVITNGAMPRMRPRVKEKRHRYTAAELNGHTHRQPIALPEEVRR